MPPSPPPGSIREQALTNARANVSRSDAEVTAAVAKQALSQAQITKQLSKQAELQKIIAKARASNDLKTEEKALKHMLKVTESLTKAQDEYNASIERTAGALRKTMTQEFQRISQGIRPAIQNMIREGADMVVKQAQNAHRAMIATAREVPRTTAEGMAQLGRATVEYEQMMVSATATALRYGQATAEIAAAQDSLIRSLSIDITRQEEAAEVVSELTDNLTFLGTRANQTAGEMSHFSTEAAIAFGAGSLNDLQAFSREFTAAAQIPAILNRELEATHGNLGATFNDPMMIRQLQEWTLNFADQATNIGEMSSAMSLFRKQMVDSGVTGVRSMNRMQQALAQGIMGRQGHDANTVLAGQELMGSFQTALRERNQGNSKEWEKLTRGMDAMDQQIVQDLVNSGTGLDASSLFHMMQTRPEGMDAMLNSIVGVTRGHGSQSLSVAAELMKAQGFDTGNDRDNLRLAELARNRENGLDVDMEEVTRLMASSAQNEEQTAADRRDVYRNVGIIEEGVSQAVTLLGSILSTLVGNAGTGGGGVLSQIVAGGAGAGGMGILGRIGAMFGLGGATAAAGAGAGAGAAGAGTGIATIGAATTAVSGALFAAAAGIGGALGNATRHIYETDEEYEANNRMMGNAFSSDEGLWRDDQFSGWQRREVGGQQVSGRQNVSDFRSFLQRQMDTEGMIVDDQEMQDFATAVRSAAQSMTAEEFAGVEDKLGDLGLLEEMQGLPEMREFFAMQHGARTTEMMRRTDAAPTPVSAPPPAAGGGRGGGGGGAGAGTTPGQGGGGSPSVQPTNINVNSDGHADMQLSVRIPNFTRSVGEANAQNATARNSPF